MQEKESLVPFLFLSLLAHILFLGGSLWFSSRVEKPLPAGTVPVMVELMGDFSESVLASANPPPVRDEPPPPEPEIPVVPSLPEEPFVEEKVVIPDPEKKPVGKKEPAAEEPKEKTPLVKRSKTAERRKAPAEQLNRSMVDTALAEMAKNLETQQGAPRQGASTGGTPGVRGNLAVGRALDLYRSQVAYRVQQNWTYAGADVSGGSVVVAFSVTRAGRVQRLVVQESSGNKLVDESARRAILKSEPFSTFPENISDSEVLVRLRFTDKGVDL